MPASGGVLISVEGVDGAGKSTQVAALAAALRAEGRKVVTLRPEETELGEILHHRLLAVGAEQPLDPWAEALLFTAARAQLLRRRVLPALGEGAVVVLDRYADTTLAYQGGGRGLPLPALRRLHADACDDVWPDLTVLLELPAEVARERRQRLGGDGDRFEAEPSSFHQAVAAAFQRLASEEPERFIRVDASGSPSGVTDEIVGSVRRRLEQRGPVLGRSPG